MNSHFDYLMAKQRAAELRRDVAKARLAKDDRLNEPADGAAGLAARTIVRLRLGGSKSRRLRIRRA